MKKFLLIILTVIMSTMLTFAQSTTGRIVGTVSTADGSVAGAVITITDTQTNKVRTITSSDDGTFEVSQLSFGTYSVKITANGFKTYLANDVKVDAGRDFALNAVLEIGQITEEVTVTAGAENVNSTGGDISTTVSAQQIRELPLNSRNPLALLNLQAGVNATSSSINGQRTSSVNYTRDGLNVQDNFIRNGFVSDAPTVDNTGEFNVVTQNAGSELGSGSTQVQLVTPRGGKQFHGALYAFNRNSCYWRENKANNNQACRIGTSSSFFNNLNGIRRPFLNRNQFGGSISGPLPVPNFGEGGPIINKDKSFFFFNYEGFRLAQQVSQSATTLVAAAQNGTFTYLGTDNVTRTVNVLTGTGLDLTTVVSGVSNGTVFNNAGGVLAVDPIIRNRLLNKLPTSGNGLSTGINYQQTVNLNRSDPEQRNAYTARFDLELTDRSSLNFVYKFNEITDARTDIGAGFSTGTFASQGGPTKFIVGAWQWSPTNSFNNEVRAGFQRSKPFFFGTTPLPSDYLIAGTNFTTPEPSFFNQGRDTDYLSIQDNAVYTVGNHSLRFGFQWQGYKISPLNLVGTTPTYNISTTGNTATPALIIQMFPGINSTDLARANALRYNLAGIIGSASVQFHNQGQGQYTLGGPQLRKLNFDIYAGYLSDSWRIRPNLTLNLGARYEVYTPLNDPLLIGLEPQVTNAADPIASLLSENVNIQVIGGNAGKPGNYFKTDKNNIGPNVSFAYSPRFENGILGSLSKDTVIRGGFKVNYNNDEYVRSADNATLNNAGFGSITVNALRNGSSVLASSLSNVGLFNAPITFIAPTTPTFPRSFNQNAINTSNFADTLSLVDPNLQVQSNLEYNLGIQKNIGFKSVLEVRYVGGLSNDLTRSIDYNQVNLNGNGFLADFARASENCRLQGALTAPAGTFDTRTFCTSAAFNAGIVGSQATPYFNQFTSLLTNATILGQIRSGQPAELAWTYIINGLVGRTENAVRNQLLANSAAGVVNYTTNGGKFRYNSLQTEVRRRFSDGYSFQVNYTFQKVLADIVDDGQTRVNPYLDNNNTRLDYARPDYDRPHTVNANVIWELPFGKGKRFLNEGGWINQIFGGFQMTSIINISKGVPYGILDTRGTLNRAGRSGRQSASSNLTAKELAKFFGTFRTPNGVFYINPANLFAVATPITGGPAAGQPAIRGFNLTTTLPVGYNITEIRGASAIDQAPFAGQLFTYAPAGGTGNLPRNFLNGPLYFNWDASVSKNIRFNENMRLQLRAEFYNVLNRASFAVGDLNIGNITSFGRVGSAFAPRILQFGARFDF